MMDPRWRRPNLFQNSDLIRFLDEKVTIKVTEIILPPQTPGTTTDKLQDVGYQGAGGIRLHGDHQQRPEKPTRSTHTHEVVKGREGRCSAPQRLESPGHVAGSHGTDTQVGLKPRVTPHDRWKCTSNHQTQSHGELLNHVACHPADIGVITYLSQSHRDQREEEEAPP